MGGIGFSLGRRGNVQLANPAMMSCLMASYAGSGLSERLEKAYREAGIADLVVSKTYQKALKLAEKAVRRTSAETQTRPTAMVMAESMASLYNQYAAVRRVTNEIHRIMTDVDLQFEEVENIPGRLVRFEGNEALVVVHEDGRDQLQTYPADLLRDLGIGETQSTFVMQRLRSGFVEVKIFFPAVGVESDGAAEVPPEEYNLPTPPKAVLERVLGTHPDHDHSHCLADSEQSTEQAETKGAATKSTPD